MPYFSDISLDRLQSVHPDLITLFMDVVKDRDCTIVSGLRTQEEQARLYAQGRSEPGNIVTYRDGITKRSNHQSGNAVDVIPYPEGYNTEALIKFSKFVIERAKVLKSERMIDHEIINGGEWRMRDFPHYELA